MQFYDSKHDLILLKLVYSLSQNAPYGEWLAIFSANLDIKKRKGKLTGNKKVAGTNTIIQLD